MHRHQTGAAVWALCLGLVDVLWGLWYRPSKVVASREVLAWPYATVHRRRGDLPRPPPPPPQTKATILGQNEIYNWENLAGPFLVHKLLGPSPRPPPPSPSSNGSLWPGTPFVSWGFEPAAPDFAPFRAHPAGNYYLWTTLSHVGPLAVQQWLCWPLTWYRVIFTIGHFAPLEVAVSTDLTAVWHACLQLRDALQALGPQQPHYVLQNLPHIVACLRDAPTSALQRGGVGGGTQFLDPLL